MSPSVVRVLRHLVFSLSLNPPIHGYYATPSECANAHLESLATPAIGGFRLTLNHIYMEVQ